LRNHCLICSVIEVNSSQLLMGRSGAIGALPELSS
jgi:hypothetical protein